MIIGLGNDLVDIRRIEQSIERFGDRFLHRVFTRGELEKAAARTTDRHAQAGVLAKRFAAKEACVKAIGKEGVSWLDMEVCNLPSGKPVLHLSGGAKARLEAQLPDDREAQIDLTMADEYPMAQAIVIISAVKT
ncbi:MAG: holo-ACP synthase [Rickettsiales bacterium]